MNPSVIRTAPAASWLAGAIALAVAGCASTPGQAPAQASVTAAAQAGGDALATHSSVQHASVNLTPASGSLVSGRLRLQPMGAGMHLTGEIGGLPRNSTHAIHIHEHGDCSAADASSAGGHFNPGNEPHGKVGTATHHAGDMDNIVSNASGVATVNVHAEGAVLGGGARNDAIGRAIVVHAQRDDYASQPSGNAGARVACGVIRAGG